MAPWIETDRTEQGLGFQRGVAVALTDVLQGQGMEDILDDKYEPVYWNGDRCMAAAADGIDVVGGIDIPYMGRPFHSRFGAVVKGMDRPVQSTGLVIDGKEWRGFGLFARQAGVCHMDEQRRAGLYLGICGMRLPESGREVWVEVLSAGSTARTAGLAAMVDEDTWIKMLDTGFSGRLLVRVTVDGGTNISEAVVIEKSGKTGEFTAKAVAKSAETVPGDVVFVVNFVPVKENESRGVGDEI